MTATQLEIPAFLSRARAPLPCTTQPCLFHAPDSHPADRESAPADRVEAAKDLCLDCPLMLACRDWARTNREAGVWGCEDDAERAAAGYPPKRLPGDPPACGTAAGAKWHRRNGSGKPCTPCLDADNAARRERQLARAAAAGVEPPSLLTAQEQRALEAFADGERRRGIAARLNISVTGADAYLRHLRSKLGAATNDELIPAAQRMDLLPTAADTYTQAA